jgi:hypothetical protein
MKRLVAVIALAAAAGGIALWSALAGGEGDVRATPPAPTRQFDLQGTVLSLDRDLPTGLGSFLARRRPLGASGVDYAMVRVTSKTKILRRAGAATKDATFGDLAVGRTVKVALVGPVAESYPVQATAGVVLILD